jgi:hypothetical protein
MQTFAIIAFTAVFTVALCLLPMGIAWHVARWALYLPTFLVGCRNGGFAGLFAGLAASLFCALVVINRGMGDASWACIFAPDFAVIGLLGGGIVDGWPHLRPLYGVKAMDAPLVLRGSLQMKDKPDLNPLANIESAARLLAEDDTPATIRQELVGIIATECEHLSASVGALIERIRDSEVHDANLSEIIDAAAREAAFVLCGRSVVRQEIAPGLPLIKCNIDQIRHLVMSLTVNVAQFAPAGAELVLKADREYDGLTLEVSDPSRGSLLAGLAQRILSPPAGSRDAVLAAAYDVVRCHGGRIEARANARKGFDFSVWLPLRRKFTDVSAQDIVGGGR